MHYITYQTNISSYAFFIGMCNFANATTVTTIFSAFRDAFTITKTQIHYADVKGTIATVPQTQKQGITMIVLIKIVQLHITSFFYQRMINSGATDQWKQYPIGGETRPQFWTCIFGADSAVSCVSETVVDANMIPQDITTCINTLHTSWSWNFGLFANTDQIKASANYQRAIDSAENMEYSFSVDFSTILLYQNIAIWYINSSITITNQGVAPFYYDLSCNINIDEVSYTLNSNSSLSSLLPGASALLIYNQIVVGSTSTIQSIYIKLISTDTYIPIKFAVSTISKSGILYIDGLDNSQPNNDNTSNLRVIISCVVGGVILLSVIGFGIYWKFFKIIKSSKPTNDTPINSSWQNEASIEVLK